MAQLDSTGNEFVQAANRSQLDALTRAVLLVHAYDAPLPHVRYRVEYSMNVSPHVPEARQDHVEADARVNSGRAGRIMLAS